MADRQLRYSIGIDVDTKQLTTQINQAVTALQKVGASPANQLSQTLRQGAAAALELGQNLKRAVNPETGKLDLVTFNNSITRGLGSITEYYNRIEKLGPAGKTAFAQMATAITSAELPIRRSSKLLDSLWITMKNTMRWQLTSSVMRGFIGGVQTAYGYAKDLDESLNRIRIVTGKNTEEMAKFAKSANDAAKALSTTTTKYTDASLIYYQQGLSNEKVKARTDATIKYANVADISTETASEQLTSIWNNFDNGSKSLEYYIDVMTKLGATTASSSSEISEGLQKFSAVANTVGLSYEYAASALATITATSRESADIVGNSLKTLFARIQGLKLGETQDDGTDLNKYSEALDAVGIKIKDTNGEIKAMDKILDELGAKWKTLGKDQQLALAQTVAGVRQYNQLISLMDNWDFFQQNLATAYGSEGTLDQQAQIYAESWEAARDRVKASAQDIYDSLINPEFYINLDNVISPLLTGIAKFIDGLGGMEGVLTAIAALMTKIYGDKIAASLRNMATNIGIVTQQERERARAIQEEVALLTTRTTLLASSDHAGRQNVEILKEEVRLRGLVNSNLDKLSSRQQENLQTEQQRLQVLINYAKELNATAAHHQQNAQIRAENILTDRNINTNYQLSKYGSGSLGDSPIGRYNRNLLNQPWVSQQYFNDRVINLSSFNGAGDAFQIIEEINSQLDVLAQKRAGIDMLTQAFQGMSQPGGLALDQVKELGVALGLLTQAESDQITTTQQLSNKMTQLGEEANVAKDKTNVLKEQLKEMGVQDKAINQYTSSLNGMYKALSEGAITTQQFRNEVEKLNQKLQDGQFKAQDWSEAIVATIRQLSVGMMAVRSISNIGEILRNEDLTGWEQFTRILSSVVMILPMVIMLFRNTGLQASWLATKNLFLGRTFRQAGTGALSFGTTLKTALPVLTLIATGIMAVISVFDQFSQAAEERRQEAEESAEAYKEESDSIKDYKEQIVKLRKELDEGNLSEQEAYDKREQLLTIQDDMCEKLGEEARQFNILKDSIDDVNGSLSEYSAEQARLLLSENSKAFEDARQEMERLRNFGSNEGNVIYKRQSAEGDPYPSKRASIQQQVKEIFNQTFGGEGNIDFIEYPDIGQTFVLNVDARTAMEKLEIVNEKLYELNEDLKKQKLDLSELLGVDSWENIIVAAMEDVREVIAENEELYNMKIQATIDANVDYNTLEERIAEIKNNYDEALKKDDKEAMVQSYQDMDNLLKFEIAKINDEEVKKWFEDLINKFQEESQKEVLKIKLKTTIEQDNSYIKEYIEGFRNNITGYINLSDIVNVEQKIRSEGLNFTNLNKQEKAYRYLASAAKTYGLEVKDIIDVLIEQGVIYDDLTDKIDKYTLSAESLKTTTEEIKAYYDALNKAKADMETGDGGLSNDTLQALAKVDPEYLDYLYEENGLIKLNTEELIRNVRVKEANITKDIKKDIQELERRNKVLKESIEYYKSLNDDKWNEKIAKDTEELEKNNETISEGEKIIAIYESTFNKLGESVDSVYSKLTGIKDGISTLGTAFKDISEDGAISYGTLEKIADEFKDVESINTYISKLASAKGNTQEVSKAMNELIDALIENKDVSGELATADESVVAAMLKEAGIANSTEQAHRLVTEAKIRNKVSAIDLKNATESTFSALQEEIQALMDEGDAAKFAENYIAALRIEQILLNDSQLNMSSSINQLITLGETAGKTVSALKALQSINSKGPITSIGDLRQQEYAQDKALQEVQDILDSYKEGIDTTNYTFTPSGGGGGGGGSSEPKQEELLGKIDETIEKYHELTRELEYYDHLITQIDEDISNANTPDKKLELEAEKVKLLNKQYELLTQKRKEAYDYVNQGAKDLKTEFDKIFAQGKLTIEFGENNEITNYEELEQYLIDQVQKATDAQDAWVTNVYNKASASTQETLSTTLDKYKDSVEDAEEALEDFRDRTGDYEKDVDTYRESLKELKSTVTSLTEAERERYNLNLEKLKQLEDKFHSLERLDSHYESRRNLLSNKIDISGTQDRLSKLFDSDAAAIQSQALDAQEIYNKAWENVWAIKTKIVNEWPDVKFDPGTAEISNYYEVLEGVRKKVNDATDALVKFNNTHTGNLTKAEEDVRKGLEKTKADMDALLGQFEEYASTYETAMDKMVESQENFSSSLLDMLQNAEDKFDMVLEKLEQMEDRFYRINRLIAWDDFESSLLDDAYDLANSDGQRADIVEKQIENLEEKAGHLEESIAISKKNITELEKFAKSTYGAEFDKYGEILSVQIKGEDIKIENTDAIYDYIEELEDELGDLTVIGTNTAYDESEQARVDWLSDEIAKWRQLIPWLEDYSDKLDDYLSANEDLSHIPVEIKEKEKDLHELQVKKNTKEIEDLATISDRYHDINRQIERQESLLSKISTATDRAFGVAKLKNYTNQLEGLNGQLENYISKLKENRDYLQADYDSLTRFGKPEINETTGELLNRDKLIEPAKAAYEKYYYDTYLPAVTTLNARIKAGKDITDEELAQYEDLTTELDILRTAYEDVTNAVTQYEESIDTREDVIEQWQDAIREIEDAKLNQIKYKLDVVIQIKDMKNAADEFSKTIAESFGDALTHGLASANWSSIIAKDEAALLEDYLREYNELKDYVANASGFIDEDGNFKYATDVQAAIDRLEELQGKIISSGESLVEWIESLEDLIPDAIKAASERLAEFTNQLEHNDSILETIKELYTLQGVTYKTTEGYNRLQRVSQERYNTQLAQAEISKKYFDGIAAELAEAQAKLDEASEGDLNYDILKSNRDALLEQYNEAQEAYLSKAREAMETAHDIYLEALERSSYDFSQAISSGVGLGLLQDKYDNYIDEEERYLDTVNELYQVNSWNLKLQEAIDNASTSAQKDRLKALQNEIDLRRQGGKLSQYDLDILEAKYNLQLAQMALEDAQNAKNKARLVRDSQGNWNYQFYADEAQVQNAQQQYLDSYKEYYNIAKQQVQDVNAEILQSFQDYNDKVKEIYEDQALTIEEREAKIAEIRRHYAEIIKGLEQEKNIAIGDMNTAGLQSILYMTEMGIASMIDMEGNSVPIVQQMSDEVTSIIASMQEETGIEFDDMTKQAVALLLQMGIDSNTIMSGLRLDTNGHILGMSEDIKSALAGMVSTSAEQGDAWSNDFANTLNEMTENTSKFDTLSDTYINNMNDNWTTYEERVKNVADNTGVSIEELDEDVNQLSDSTDKLHDSGLNAVDSLLEQVDAAHDASWSYIELADSIMETVSALEELARAWVEVDKDLSEGIGVGTNVHRIPGINLDTSSKPSSGDLGDDNNDKVEIKLPEIGEVTVDGEGKIPNITGTPIDANKYDVDWSDLMTQAVIRGDMDTANILGAIREKSYHWKTPGAEDNWRDNKTVIADALEMKKNNITPVYKGPFKNNELTFEEWMRRLGIKGYATGGYTGDFDNGKLAFLHEKELVLNQQDTQNILAAVSAIRSINPDLLSQIEKILDGNAISAMAALTSKITAIQLSTGAGVLEQAVTIEANFPNVTDRNEIQEAFNSLINDAAQYARRRKE